MELPWLKNKTKGMGGAMAPVMAASTHPDAEGSMDDSLIDHVSGEFLEAIEKKDKRLLREALRALIQYLQDEDEKQDEGMIS